MSILNFIYTSILCITLQSWSFADSNFKKEEPLQGQAFISDYHLEPSKPFVLKLDLSLPEGYRAYSDKFKIEILDPDGFKYQNFEVKPLKKFYDETSKKNKMGLIGKGEMTIPMESPSHLADGNYKLKILVHYQACTKSYCLFPTTLELSADFNFTAPMDTSKISNEMPTFAKMNFESALAQGLFWAFIFVFIAGFLTSLTPCIFPMIPITIAVLGRHAHLHSKRKNFFLSILYVLGIALTYSALGVFATATGSMFGSFMSHPAVLFVICLVFLLMSLSMFGLFELQAPEFVRNKLSGDLKIHGYSSAFVYGVIAGIVAGPCVGPVLVGILTYVAKTQNMWIGFWLLFTFAVGMGQLFLILGFSSQFTKLLPKSGSWMESIKNFFGLLMMVAFFYYLSLLVPLRIWDALLGLSIIAYGSLFGAFESNEKLKSNFSRLKKGLLQSIIFVGAAYLTIAIFNLRENLHMPTQSDNSSTLQEKTEATWSQFSEEKLAEAKKLGKPAMIDFWAEWCGACHELEKNTFSTTEFKNIGKDFILLKFDATNESEKLEELRNKFNIIGLPTLVFFDKNGQWQSDKNISQFIESPELVEKMNQVLKSN